MSWNRSERSEGPGSGDCCARLVSRFTRPLPALSIRRTICPLRRFLSDLRPCIRPARCPTSVRPTVRADVRVASGWTSGLRASEKVFHIKAPHGCGVGGNPALARQSRTGARTNPRSKGEAFAMVCRDIIAETITTSWRQTGDASTTNLRQAGDNHTLARRAGSSCGTRAGGLEEAPSRSPHVPQRDLRTMTNVSVSRVLMCLDIADQIKS